VFRSSLKSRLQAVCDSFTEAWDLPAGTLTAEAVGSNSPRPLSEAGLGAIPMDEQGVPMIDNIGQENVISPELLRAGICLSHARLFGMVVYVNGIPAYVSPNTRLAIPYGEHLKVERELQIIVIKPGLSCLAAPGLLHQRAAQGLAIVSALASPGGPADHGCPPGRGPRRAGS
jgi:hypothetical protein